MQSEKAKPAAALLAVVLLVGAAASEVRGETTDNAAQRIAYDEARRAYYRLKGDPDARRYRHNWLRIIDAFAAVVAADVPETQAAKALYNMGKLWRELCDASHNREDAREAAAVFSRLATRYPHSSLADDALLQRAGLLRDYLNDSRKADETLRTLVAEYPDGDMVPTALRLLGASPSGPPEAPSLAEPASLITALRVGRHPDRVRVVVEMSSTVETALSRHEKTFELDLPATAIREDVPQQVRLGPGPVASVSLARKETAWRLVIDAEPSAKAALISLAHPPRLVVDVRPDLTKLPREPNSDSLSHKRCVMLDPGHGGHDTGAIGVDGIQEKDVVLAIAREAGRYLEAAGIDVVFTRQTDAFLPLRERTALANEQGVDLFVSIHANAARNPKARGVETYFLNVAHDRYALRLAAVENQMSEKAVGDLQLILADLSAKAQTPESVALAHRVQQQMFDAMLPLNPAARDLGVKSSLFYVLLGARMPSILVETSFLSNPREGALLASTAYQRALARAIADGVTEHLRTPIHLVSP